MNARERFLNALRGRKVDRRPVWLMRQAGRYLPEYRALRAKYGFLEMVKTPELAAQITLQPVRRFPVSAAIVFSDILTVPEALGVPYAFREGGGIRMEREVLDESDIRKLDPERVEDRLQYVYAALAAVRAELGQTRALLGFAGAPWTLAAYMVEGESAAGFPKFLAFARRNPRELARLLETLADAVARHLRAQIAAGADAVQIFDTWAGLCPPELFEFACLQSLRAVVERLGADANVIYFAKGVSDTRLWQTGARALSFGSGADLPAVARTAPSGCAVQGNLPPETLLLPPERVAQETRLLLEKMDGARGYIANLGHGVLPQTSPEAVAAFVETVDAYRVAPEIFLGDN